MSVVNPGDVRNMEQWLECQLDKGMFSDEMAVTYPAKGTPQKSVFVSSRDVKGQPGQPGRVRVRIIRRGAELLAVLPSSCQDIVWISERELSEE